MVLYRTFQCFDGFLWDLLGGSPVASDESRLNGSSSQLGVSLQTCFQSEEVALSKSDAYPTTDLRSSEASLVNFSTCSGHPELPPTGSKR